MRRALTRCASSATWRGSSGCWSRSGAGDECEGRRAGCADAWSSAWPAAASRCSPRTPSTASAAIPRTSRRQDACIELKGRPAARPAAVMFFALEPALETLSELLDAERAALQALLPGPVTLLLANRALRFAPACRTDPVDARTAGPAPARAPGRAVLAGEAGDAVQRQPLGAARRASAGGGAAEPARRRRPRARRRRAAGQALDGDRPARLPRRPALARPARGRAPAQRRAGDARAAG